jgi:hypothetical protein
MNLRLAKRAAAFNWIFFDNRGLDLDHLSHAKYHLEYIFVTTASNRDQMGRLVMQVLPCLSLISYK